MPVLRDLILALGLVLSAASQLRLGGLPIGPGEVLLVIWLALVIGREAIRLGPPLNPVLLKLVTFWLLFMAAQSLGTLTGFLIADRHDTDLFTHDIFAYALLAPVSVLCVAKADPRASLRRVATLATGLGSGLLVLQLAQVWHFYSLPQIEPWYWDRLRGWSANPNQLAFFCSALGLISLVQADVADTGCGRIAAIGCLILAIYVGQLSKSDTFSLVAAASIPIFLTLKIYSSLTVIGAKLTFKSASAWIAVLSVPLILASAIPLGTTILRQAQDYAKEINVENGNRTEREAEMRLQLWGQAFNRGLESGLLGLGPGPHLEIPPLLVAARQSTANQPTNIEHPPVNDTPDFEAHNTLLDLFTQGGLLAVASFLWLTGSALFTAYKAGSASLMTMLIGLLIFGMSNLIVRQPLFWFAIVLCLVAGFQPAKARATRMQTAHRAKRLADSGLSYSLNRNRPVG